MHQVIQKSQNRAPVPTLVVIEAKLIVAELLNEGVDHLEPSALRISEEMELELETEVVE